MKLTQYINESGETQYRSRDGTIIPANVIEEWQLLDKDIDTMTIKHKQYLSHLQDLLSKHEDN